jgi:hypothetical protein
MIFSLSSDFRARLLTHFRFIAGVIRPSTENQKIRSFRGYLQVVWEQILVQEGKILLPHDYLPLPF